MYWTIATLTSRTREQVHVDHEGFFNGAHEVDLKKGLEELEASFNQKKAAIEQAFSKVIREIEGRLEFLKKIAPEIQGEWASVRDRIGDEKPRLAVPLLIVSLGLFAILAESLLLAPSLDMLGVADRLWQQFTALGLCALAAVIFHLAWDTVHAQRLSRLWKITWRLIAAFATPALASWGILRGYQVAFSSELSQNPLADFLHGHPFLASIFYVFITLATPIAAAGALHFASTHVHDWYQYTTSKRKAYAVSNQLATLGKKLQQETESRSHTLKAVEEQKNRFKASYALHHERGQKRLARKSPLWIVQLKALAASILTAVVVYPVLWIYHAAALLPFFVYIVAFICFRHLREHPTPQEYYDHEVARFADKEEEDDR